MKSVFQEQVGDAVLWDDFRAGNIQAFTALYNTYVRSLYNYGRKFTTDKALLEDCIQDMFIDLWKRRENLGSTDSPKYYLFATLRHRIIRMLQSSIKFLPDTLPEEYEFEITLSPEASLINKQISHEQKTYVDQALQSLTKRQKEAVFLKFFEDLSYEEIASVMDLELRSVYNLISKSLEALKRNAHKALAVLLLVLQQS